MGSNLQILKGKSEVCRSCFSNSGFSQARKNIFVHSCELVRIVKTKQL